MAASLCKAGIHRLAKPGSYNGKQVRAHDPVGAQLCCAIAFGCKALRH
jgi:hypothetical protein